MSLGARSSASLDYQLPENAGPFHLPGLPLSLCTGHGQGQRCDSETVYSFQVDKEASAYGSTTVTETQPPTLKDLLLAEGGQMCTQTICIFCKSQLMVPSASWGQVSWKSGHSG